MRPFVFSSLILLLGAATTYSQQWPAYPPNYRAMGSSAPMPGYGPSAPLRSGYYPHPHASYYQRPHGYYHPMSNSGRYSQPSNYFNSNQFNHSAGTPYDDGPVYYSVEDPSQQIPVTTTPKPLTDSQENLPNEVPDSPSNDHPTEMPEEYEHYVESGFPADGVHAPQTAHEPVQYREKCWGFVGYMSSWIKSGSSTVPLVTTGSPGDAVPGATGQPGTTILAGNEEYDFGRFNGVKGEVGLWLDRANHYSMDLGGFYLFQQSLINGFSSDAGGNPPLFRPVFDLAAKQPDAFITTFPGVSAGSSTVEADSEMFGVELNARRHCCPCEHLRLQGLLGFRFLNLEESIIVTDRLQPLANNIFTFQGQIVDPPSQLTDTDTFGTLNRFYGFQIGGQVGWEMDKLTERWLGKHNFRSRVDLFAKVALGVTSREIDVQGETTLISSAGNQTVPGGILALPSTAGEQTHTEFSVVPEFGVNLGVDVTKHLRVKTGYSFLFWTNVVRPGDQINGNVIPSQIPTDQTFTGSAPVRNAFAFVDELFWMHNVFVGIEFHR